MSVSLSTFPLFPPLTNVNRTYWYLTNLKGLRLSSLRKHMKVHGKDVVWCGEDSNRRGEYSTVQYSTVQRRGEVRSQESRILEFLNLDNDTFEMTLLLWPLSWLELLTFNSQSCTITEKAPTRALSLLKAATSAFKFKTLLWKRLLVLSHLRHYYEGGY